MCAGVILGLAAVACAESVKTTVDCKVPAGNIVVEKIEGDTVRVKPDLRDTKGDWFYWG